MAKVCQQHLQVSYREIDEWRPSIAKLSKLFVLFSAGLEGQNDKNSSGLSACLKHALAYFSRRKEK